MQCHFVIVQALSAHPCSGCHGVFLPCLVQCSILLTFGCSEPLYSSVLISVIHNSEVFETPQAPIQSSLRSTATPLLQLYVLWTGHHRCGFGVDHVWIKTSAVSTLGPGTCKTDRGHSACQSILQRSAISVQNMLSGNAVLTILTGKPWQTPLKAAITADVASRFSVQPACVMLHCPCNSFLLSRSM